VPGSDRDAAHFPPTRSGESSNGRAGPVTMPPARTRGRWTPRTRATMCDAVVTDTRHDNNADSFIALRPPTARRYPL